MRTHFGTLHTHEAPLLRATADNRNVSGGVDYTIDKQRELLDMYILAAASFGANNFTDLFPVREFHIR